LTNLNQLTNGPGYITSAGTATNVTNLSGTWDGINYFRSNKGAASYLGANNNYALQAYSTDGGAAAMSFHRGGSYAVNMGLDPDNVFRIGGWSASSNRWQLDMSGNETIAGSLNLNGNINFANANPTISASSYFIAPGGAYFNSGTVYTEAPIQARGGIHNDAASYLTLSGGTSAHTYVDGSLGVGTASPHAKFEVTGGAWTASALSDSSMAADNKTWDWTTAGGTLYMRAVNDAYSAATTYMQVVRSGYGITSVSFPAGNVGIGTPSPSSPLTVNGVIESKSGGVKFPDGTTQTTAAGSSAGKALVILTSGTSWTVPAGVTSIKVTAIGGGGSGGCGSWSSGGGGGGGMSQAVVTGLTPSSSISYSIGAGGSACTAASNNSGNSGGSTVFGPANGTTLTSNGGAGGTANGANGGTSGSAAGGSASGGTINITGQSGSGSAAYYIQHGGAGGSSANSFGLGGAAVMGPGVTNGNPGTGYGGGGGGGGGGGTAGAGTSGAVVIEY
jgi:hypothetical protein